MDNNYLLFTFPIGTILSGFHGYALKLLGGLLFYGNEDGVERGSGCEAAGRAGSGLAGKASRGLP